MTELTAARLAADHTVWSVWMEDSDSWDGVGLYLDEQTALVHAAADYAMDEYRYPDPDDPDQVAPNLTWTKRYSRWQLADEGRDTGIRAAEVNVYRPATAEETKPEGRDCPACDAGIEHTEHCPTPETHNAGCGCPSDVAAAYASCPGYEMSPSPCRCPCYGCKHHCSAHQSSPTPAP